jgi:hypothetical protein
MKRLPEIIAFFFIIPALIASGITKNRSVETGSKVLAELQVHDTSGLVSFLKIDSMKLDIIPPSSGVQFFRDGIIFLSNTKYEGKMLPKHVSFGSIEAYTAIIKDTAMGLHLLFSPSSSFSFPCEATTFSSDFKTMYFTKIAKREKKERIYHAELKSNAKGETGWIADENPLDFCTGNYIYTHPALSADGKMMVFASDMESSLGGLDLFFVRKEGEKWSKPENLGKSINTIRYECFPNLDQDNNLFFSSDGLGGYGGYDIFTCKFNGETWDRPVNLSHRINSGNDDIAFCINKTDGKSAFFTSRQQSGKEEMHLFRVALKQETANNHPLSIPFIYNGDPLSKKESLAMKPAGQTKLPENEPSKTATSAVKKEVKVEEKKAAAGPVTAAPSAKLVTIKPTSNVPEELQNVVVYRVQFLTTTKPRKESQIVINGVSYNTYEYIYLGAYRYTIGEFTTLPPARELQSLCKKSGYPEAFVGAFKGNMRSLDLTTFK